MKTVKLTPSQRTDLQLAIGVQMQICRQYPEDPYFAAMAAELAPLQLLIRRAHTITLEVEDDG